MHRFTCEKPFSKHNNQTWHGHCKAIFWNGAWNALKKSFSHIYIVYIYIHSTSQHQDNDNNHKRVLAWLGLQMAASLPWHTRWCPGGTSRGCRCSPGNTGGTPPAGGFWDRSVSLLPREQWRPNGRPQRGSRSPLGDTSLWDRVEGCTACRWIRWRCFTSVIID